MTDIEVKKQSQRELNIEAKKQGQREIILEEELPEIMRPTKTVRVSRHYRRPPISKISSLPSEPVDEA